jgi:CubicO group peptidase (beta-lactamase class C family)/energy-converting hydrogenase Eha subunit E
MRIPCRATRVAALLTVVLVSAAPLAGAQPASASQPPAPAAAPASAAQAGPRDPKELEAFMDGVMAAYLRDKHIAGATVAVVRDSTILLAKGYGYADVAKRTPVDPRTSLFRIGSISKLFTWTAVMQLVEQGKLDLDADINRYLDFTIPATFPEPITLRHVLTHTPGFEEDGRDLFTDDPARVASMKTWLPAHMPARVRPPGVHASYSNWATAVAGYIVERVSGVDYDTYMERFLFEPLGMRYASSRQPLPAALQPYMAQGYQYAAATGGYTPKKFEIVTGAAPAGSFSVSAVDMAAFMQAHLFTGAWNGRRILADSTARRMQTRLHGHDPRIPGFAHGFYEQSTVGPRAIGHGGDTQWFHSDLILLPSEKVGFFVSFNTSTGSAVSFKPFADDVLGHYYPQPVSPLPPSKDDAATLGRFAGEYVFNRRSYTTFQKAVALQGAVKVAVDTGGALRVATPFGTLRMMQVDSLLFRDVLGHDLIAFQQDASGTVTHAFLSMAPMMVLERQTGMRAPSFHLAILGLGLLTAVATLGAAVVRFFGRHGRVHQPDALIRQGRWVMTGGALLLVGFVAAIAGMAADPIRYILGNELGTLKVALVLPVLAALATGTGAGIAVRQWRTGAGSVAMRVRHLLAVTVMLACCWSLYSWNLLGWRL